MSDEQTTTTPAPTTETPKEPVVTPDNIQTPQPPADPQKPEAPKEPEVKKPEETPPKEEEKKVIELKAPENFSQERVDEIKKFAEENNLSNEQAQKIVDREANLSQTFIERQKEELNKQSEAWLESIRKDSELGGEAVNENVELSKRVIQRYGSPELVKVLEDSRMGNYPELVRIFSRIGRAMGEDKIVLPNSTTQEDARSAAEIIYGK